MALIQAIAATKLMNMFPSVAATAIFAWRGMVDFKLGLLFGAVMFAAGLLKGRVALKLNATWLRESL